MLVPPDLHHVDLSSLKWIAIAAVVASALGRAWWRWRTGAARQRKLMLLCQRAGLDFAALDLFGDTAWLPFPMFGRPQHGTENVVWERARGTGIRAFDFWYEEPAEDRAVGPKRRLTCAVVPLGASVRRLRISPRDLDDDVRSVLGLREVELELEEFNWRFVVETEDERFAIAFLEQRLMEALLALPDGVTVEVNEDVVLLSAPLLPAEQVLRLYDAAVAIHKRIPRSLPSLYPPRPHEGPFEDRWLQGHWTPDPTGGVGT
ncbi:MAG: hypothetical protein ACRDHU_04275 [Actinomycetota bacterium]